MVSVWVMQGLRGSRWSCTGHSAVRKLHEDEERSLAGPCPCYRSVSDSVLPFSRHKHGARQDTEQRVQHNSISSHDMKLRLPKNRVKTPRDRDAEGLTRSPSHLLRWWTPHCPAPGRSTAESRQRPPSQCSSRTLDRLVRNGSSPGILSLSLLFLLGL